MLLDHIDCLIFLDIDGCLNTTATRHRFGNDALSPHCLIALADIINKTNAKIVISSDWRLGHASVDSFIASFDECIQMNCTDDWARKIIISAIVGLTLDFGDMNSVGIINRGTQVQEWIDANGFDGRCAILDDDVDLFDGFASRDCLFITDTDVGLTEKIADKVIKHLNG